MVDESGERGNVHDGVCDTGFVSTVVSTLITGTGSLVHTYGEGQPNWSPPLLYSPSYSVPCSVPRLTRTYTHNSLSSPGK